MTSVDTSAKVSPLGVWVQAIRPKTLAASVVPVLVGTVLALAQAPFQPTMLLAIVAFALLIQIGTNFANDLFDYLKGADTSSRKGPLRVTQAGLLSPRRMMQATLLVLGLSLLPGTVLIAQGGLPIFVVVFLSILFALLYSGGPWPLAYLGLGEVFVFIFFGVVAVSATAYLYTAALSPTAIVVGASLGLISSAILVVNNVRDYESDALAQKRTLVVRFGKRFGKIEYCVLLLGAALLPFFSSEIRNEHPWSLIAAGYLIAALPHMKSVCMDSSPSCLNYTLEQTSKLLMLFALLFCDGWLYG